MILDSCVENTDEGYMIRNNSYMYWLGGFYGSDNFGLMSQAHIYRDKTKVFKVKKDIEKHYGIYVSVVKIKLEDLGDANE